MKSLFKNLDLENLSPDTILEAFQQQQNLPQIKLTFKWTANRRLVFVQLHLKVGGVQTDLLGGNAVNKKTGDHTFSIGSFLKGEKLEIEYKVMGLVLVPKIVAILSQDNPATAFQADPKNPLTTNQIEPPVKLAGTIKYTVL